MAPRATAWQPSRSNTQTPPVKGKVLRHGLEAAYIPVRDICSPSLEHISGTACIAVKTCRNRWTQAFVTD